MELLALESKLIDIEGLKIVEMDEILNFVELNVKAFLYVKSSLSFLEVYVVLKNSGGYGIFKRVKGFIVEDKADKSYSSSRALLGIDTWDIKAVYRVGFASNDGLGMNPIITKLNPKEFKNTLQSVIRPVWSKYVAGFEEGNVPVVLSVDSKSLGRLSYRDYISCMDDSYIHKTNGGCKRVDTSYMIVDYSTLQGGSA